MSGRALGRCAFWAQVESGSQSRERCGSFSLDHGGGKWLVNSRLCKRLRKWQSGTRRKALMPKQQHPSSIAILQDATEGSLEIDRRRVFPYFDASRFGLEFAIDLDQTLMDKSSKRTKRVLGEASGGSPVARHVHALRVASK